MKKIKEISLYYNNGSSNKEYHAQVVLVCPPNGYNVTFQYGRVGNALQSGTKNAEPLDLEKATKVFNKLVTSKEAKGYTKGKSGVSYTGTSKENRKTGLIPQLLNPIDDNELEKYLTDDNWGMQEKLDGKHVMKKCNNGKVIASNRKGLEISFPESIKDEFIKNINVFGDAIFDGEAIGEKYYIFDTLQLNGIDQKSKSYCVRHTNLSSLFKKNMDTIEIVPLHIGTKAKRTFLAKMRKDNKEGVVFKLLSAPYVSGRPNSKGDQVKFKFYATLSAVAITGRVGKRSIGLKLVDKNKWLEVGNVTVPQNQPIPKPMSIVEIRYLYAYKGGSVYQPTLIGIRDDIDKKECTIKQLKFKEGEN